MDIQCCVIMCCQHNNHISAIWFLRGDVQNTLKFPFMPGADLKEALQKQVDKTFKDQKVAGRGATKVVKLGGRPLLAGLSSHQNFGGKTGCQFGREKCLAPLDTTCSITWAVYMNAKILQHPSPVYM